MNTYDEIVDAGLHNRDRIFDIAKFTGGESRQVERVVSKRFPIGSVWVAAYGNGYKFVVIEQVDKYHINNKQYSKNRLSRYFNRIL